LCPPALEISEHANAYLAMELSQMLTQAIHHDSCEFARKKVDFLFHQWQAPVFFKDVFSNLLPFFR
jgi:hypothetical protein